jgi:hypothetical protein
VRARAADFEVGGRRYGVFAHDWRVEGPLEWITRKGLLEFNDAAAARSNVVASDSLVVLSQQEFEHAVRQALRDATRPAELAKNPLARSRVALESGDTLQALLRRAAETLRGNPKDEKLYRALECTYFQPADSQEAAAERLGLPFSTYRYQLNGGIARVTDWLWQHELKGFPAGFRLAD